MTKSFKEIYDIDKNAPEKKEESLVEKTTDITDDTEPTIEILEDDKLSNQDIANVLVDITESIQGILTEQREESTKTLTEQREQSAKILESVMRTNTKIANSIPKLVKSNADSQNKLAKAVILLSEQVATLEEKLDLLKNIEIPTPIVHVQMPSKTIDIHRDTKGLITHISESEAPDADTDTDEGE